MAPPATVSAVRPTQGAADLDRTRRVVFAVALLTAALYVMPYGQWVGYPLMLLSTFAHEMGHGIAGWLLGGAFDSFRMYADGSGMAQMAGDFGRLARGAIAAGGLVGPAVLAALFFPLSSRRTLARWGLIAFGAAMLLSCVLVVRGLFGWVFVGGVGALCLLIALRASASVSQGLVALLASQLALSVFSRGDYLFMKVAQTGSGPAPSDVAQMSDALLLPYWFWGSVCGLFSVAVLLVGLWIFWRATRPATGAMAQRSSQP